jgi:hypothetical protein
MDVVCQTWEKRNLGIDSYELRYSERDPDSANGLGSLLTAYQDADMLMARVPANKMKIVYSLQDAGFLFAEANFSLIKDLRNEALPPYYDRYTDRFTDHPADKGEVTQILDAVQKGMFDTDKFALSPYFSPEMSANRYRLWIEDEILNAKSHAYVVTLSDRNIGFYLLKKESDRKFNSMFAGLFDRDKAAGFGFSCLYLPIRKAKEGGGTSIETGVSSNNLSSVRTHLSLGYEISGISYILLKHRMREYPVKCGV